MRSALKLFAVACSVLCSQVRAEAQTVTLDGLTIPCADCEMSNAGECSITFTDTARTVSCSLALAELLGKLADSTEVVTKPTTPELRRMLLRPELDPRLASSALSVMLRQPSGAKALMEEAAIFASRYPEELAQLFMKGQGSAELLDVYWKLPQTEGVKLGAGMRAAIASRVPAIGLSGLLSDLSIVDIARDEATLSEYEQVLLAIRPEWAQQVTELRSVVRFCSETAKAGRSEDQCQIGVEEKVGADLFRYFSRVRAHYTLLGIAGANLNTVDTLKRLENIDFSSLRTPESHAQILKLVEKALEETPDQREALLERNARKMVKVFAQNDRGIAKAYGELLAKGSSDLWRQGRDEDAVVLLDESLEVYPAELERRRELFLDFRASPAVNRSERVKAAVAEIRRGSISVEAVKENPWLIVPYVLMVVPLLLIGWGFVIFFVRRRRESQEEMARRQYERAMLREQMELRELLRGFDLEEDAGEVELLRAYRKLAKESHPDASQEGSEIDFSNMTMKYKRAKDLMHRANRWRFAAGEDGESEEE